MRLIQIPIPDADEPIAIAEAITHKLAECLKPETLVLTTVGIVEVAKERVGEDALVAALGIDDAIEEALTVPPDAEEE